MSKTPYSKQVEILADVWFYYHNREDNDEGWQSFFDIEQLILATAYSISRELVSSNDDMVPFIENTWSKLCDNLGLDADNHYASMQHMIDLARE
jgi:hypothetical protein